LARKLIFENCSNCGKKIVDDEKALLIDDHNDLIFCDENCVREFFEAEIDALEVEMESIRTPGDIPLPEFPQYEHFLPLLLNQPDEVWEVQTNEEQAPLSFYIGEFFYNNDTIYYVAAVYRADDRPSFVYMHFPTKDINLADQYRRGEMIFGSENADEVFEDEITESNISIELYNEMLEYRSEADIDPEDFTAYGDLKLSTVEHPEEIWRRIDDSGNTFIVYIAQYQRENENIGYVVVAVEDEISDSAIPVFGFPTIDQKLLDRFRTGEMIFKASENF
jgi:hypothetical protein